MSNENAIRYDHMINWDIRLNREIPVISEYFGGGSVLDIACSSGRHSFALEDKGFSTVGVDISAGFIQLAKELKGERKSQADFLQCSATASDLRQRLLPFGRYFDNVLMLGNAIANMGALDEGKKLMYNIFLMLRPGGKAFFQTVNRPERPYYLPLRSLEGGILQRIQVPRIGNDYNIELHVNLIKDGVYARRTINSDFYMYSYDEFENLLHSAGFNVVSVLGGYSGEAPNKEGGSTVLWKVIKPEIDISPESITLFSISEIELREKVMDIWQDLYQVMQYNFVRMYRFIHPRVLSHPRYRELNLIEKRILDLGCALGTDLEQMIYDGANPELLVGVDLSCQVLQMRERLFVNRGIQFYCGDICGDSFTGKYGESQIFEQEYDLIFSGSLLHLLDESQVMLVMQRVASALVSGGIFIGRVVVREEDTVNESDYYSYLHTLKSFQKLLDDNGFTNVELVDNKKSVGACERSYDGYLTISFYCIH